MSAFPFRVLNCDKALQMQMIRDPINVGPDVSTGVRPSAIITVTDGRLVNMICVPINKTNIKTTSTL